MYYQISGQGQPLVFIHGFAGSSQWWRGQKAFFESDYQVLTVDLPGHGQSPWQRGTLAEMATDLYDILKTLDLQQINIVASSLGGLVALELYRRIPEQIHRMSFVGSIPKFARPSTSLGANSAYPAGLDIEKIRTLSEQFDGDYASILDIFFRSLFTMKERESKKFKDLKSLRQNEPVPRREALQAFLDILEKTDLRDRLLSIVCPVQFITGAEDYICPKDVMEWLKEHMLHARLDFIDGCGHLPFLTKPQQYNDLLENFLIN